MADRNWEKALAEYVGNESSGGNNSGGWKEKYEEYAKKHQSEIAGQKVSALINDYLEKYKAYQQGYPPRCNPYPFRRDKFQLSFP